MINGTNKLETVKQAFNQLTNWSDYNEALSKRLNELNIKTPRYKKTDRPVEVIHAVAIDSTGLKRFGRGEWHNERYELSSKVNWCKFHAGVNKSHYMEAFDKTPVYKAVLHTHLMRLWCAQ